MNYEEKISAATRLIEDHNQNTPGSRIKVDAVIASLKLHGGTTNEALSECSWEDLQQCGLPVILARVVAKAFRADDRVDFGVGRDSSGRRLSRPHVDTMSIEELLEAYDPLEPDNRVGKRLKTITRGKRCLIFVGGKIAIEPSAMLVRELRDGFPEVLHHAWLGDVHPTHHIGDRPQQTFDENPLYPGQPLRPGDICAFTGLDWSDVNRDVRQVIYLAVTKTSELVVTPGTADEVHRLAQDRDSDRMEAIVRVKQRFRRAAVKFNELVATDSLPSLKINPAAHAAKLPEGRKVR